MGFYKNSCKEIGAIIKEMYPHTVPLRYGDFVDKVSLPSHLLWMIGEMEQWDTSSIKRAVKAGRWIGWIFRSMEELGVWCKADSRKFAKKDVDAGYHLPH